MTAPDWLRRLAGAAFIFASLNAAAAQFGVAPVRLHIGAGQRVQTLTVTNPDPRPLTVQIEAYAWTQPDGADRLSATHEVVISPPIARIAGGESAKVRVGLRRPTAAPVERAFRILVTEILPDDPASSAPVQFRTRMSLPLFVPPESDASLGPALHWKREGQDLIVANHGELHAQIRELSLDTGNDRLPMELPQLGYLLPGTQRRWLLPAHLEPSATVIIKTRREEIRGPASAGP